MVSQDSQLYLAQMLDNIERIRLWTSGHTLETYRANLMLRDAVERCLERISETSRRLPEEMKATQPHIPWRKVADVGNVLRHEYDDVADAEVWRIVVDDLSTLRSAIQSMIDES
jgi:uncharacterized protein with HEPN domain